MKHCVTILILLPFISVPATAQNYSSYNQQFVSEHIYKGFPGYDNIYVRQAYILSYNHEHRIPNWVAYHVLPDYTKTVPRHDIFNFFRTDRNVPNPVQEYEYEGLNEDGNGYVPGQLAPFGISGGDRDGDLLYGVADLNRDGRVTKVDMEGRELSEFIEDADEISRVYEINYTSNVAPMHAGGLRDPDGIWVKLERFVQEVVALRRQQEIWVIAGTVTGKGESEKVGPNADITVPPAFFKIVIRNDKQGDPVVLAFLLPHHKTPHGHIRDYLVSVDVIEALTGLDFFRELDEETESKLERTDTSLNWETF